MWHTPAVSLGAVGFVCGGYIISDSEYIIAFIQNRVVQKLFSPLVNQLYGNNEAQDMYNEHLHWKTFT